MLPGTALDPVRLRQDFGWPPAPGSERASQARLPPSEWSARRRNCGRSGSGQRERWRLADGFRACTSV